MRGCGRRFNSSLVRLGVVEQDDCKCYNHQFQFQLGAIGSSSRFIYDCNHCLSFNSSLVRLREFSIEELIQKIESFNSSLVRLRGHFPESQGRWQNKFQFQLGAIESIYPGWIRCNDPTFQFQLGAIESKFYKMSISKDKFVSIPAWCD